MMRRARRIVRSVSGITLVKRFVFDGVSIPDGTAANFDNEVEIPLIETLATVDEEVESDGAGAIADVPIYSRMTGFKANLYVAMTSSTPSDIRWMLYKEPDGESLVTDLSTQFHSSDDSPTMREIRKYTLAKGQFRVNASAQMSRFPIFISRAAMRRCSPMRLNDRITLVIAKANDTTTGTLHGFGSIYFKANA